MRQLHVNSQARKSTSKNEILYRLKNSKIDEEMVDLLFKELENGNAEVIDQLINVLDEMIFQVMLALPESKHDLDERLAHAKTSLRKLASLSIRTPGKRLFERFCAFQIRQSLIVLALSKGL